MQLSDALSDRNKATETISSLQVRVDSKFSSSLMRPYYNLSFLIGACYVKII